MTATSAEKVTAVVQLQHQNVQPPAAGATAIACVAALARPIDAGNGNSRQHIRGYSYIYNEMCCINLRFTYLLTYCGRGFRLLG